MSVSFSLTFFLQLTANKVCGAHGVSAPEAVMEEQYTEAKIPSTQLSAKIHVHA